MHAAIADRTDRLLLCLPQPEDTSALFSFMGSADAMRYTHVVESLEEMSDRLIRHEAQRSRIGFAPWVLRLRTTAEVVGWGGLYEDPFDPGWGLEAGYFFNPSVWGHGYASEFVAACARMADTRLIAVLRAFCHPENHASRRVLEKNGFEFARFITEANRNLFERLSRAP
jgi:ribosomal-protein-alanine N-acetyltransferase